MERKRKMKKAMIAVGALVAASAFAGFDPSSCRIPEKFKDHPLFTEPVVGANFGYGGKRTAHIIGTNGSRATGRCST